MVDRQTWDDRETDTELQRSVEYRYSGRFCSLYPRLMWEASRTTSSPQPWRRGTTWPACCLTHVAPAPYLKSVSLIFTFIWHWDRWRKSQYQLLLHVAVEPRWQVSCFFQDPPVFQLPEFLAKIAVYFAALKLLRIRSLENSCRTLEDSSRLLKNYSRIL